MSYSAEINRANPLCFMFLVDQSGSMREPFGAGSGKSKAEGVADALNRLLQTLALRCAKTEGIRDYFHIGVIGYGETVGSLLVQQALHSPETPLTKTMLGQTAPDCLAPISVVANNPLRVESRSRMVEDGAGGLVAHAAKFPVWLEPVAKGRTPMCAAIDMAWNVLNQFVNSYPHCFPPIVLNISDGAATDGDPARNAVSIHDLASSDGRTLLFNVHLSSRGEAPIVFPNQETGLPNDYARMLFRMSSLLPPAMRSEAQQEGYDVSDLTRGFAFNADLVSVIRFLDIGTRVTGRLR